MRSLTRSLRFGQAPLALLMLVVASSPISITTKHRMWTPSTGIMKKLDLAIDHKSTQCPTALAGISRCAEHFALSSQKLSRVTRFTQHVTQFHRYDLTGPPMACPVCARHFYWAKSMGDHITRQHADRSLNCHAVLTTAMKPSTQSESVRSTITSYMATTCILRTKLAVTPRGTAKSTGWAFSQTELVDPKRVVCDEGTRGYQPEEELVECTDADCGFRFQSTKELTYHETRRHVEAGSPTTSSLSRSWSSRSGLRASDYRFSPSHVGLFTTAGHQHYIVDFTAGNTLIARELCSICRHSDALIPGHIHPSRGLTNRLCSHASL